MPSIARRDLEENLTFVNDSYCRVFGKSRDELLGKPFTPPVLPEDLPITSRLFEELKQPPYRTQTETRHVTPTGIRWFSWDNAAIVDENGTIIEFQRAGRDITERKQSEEALRESEQRYRQLVENIPAGLIVNTPDTRITFANQRAGTLLRAVAR